LRSAIPSRLMLTAMSLYGVVRLLAARVAGLSASPLRLYGPDLLAPLVLIPLFTWMQVWWGLRSSQQALSGGEILAYVSGISLVYEGVLPLWSSRSSADPLDVVAYAVGGMVLWMWTRRHRAARISRRPATRAGAVPQEMAPGR